MVSDLLQDASDGFLDYIVLRGIIKATTPPNEYSEDYLITRCSAYPEHKKYYALLNSCED